jgi:ThiF family
MELLETLNRTMKLAMDEGKVDSYEEAQALFATFRLHIRVQPGFTKVPAAEAAVLTMLTAAPKTFLGGVEVAGALDERCSMAWFRGLRLSDVAEQCGVKVVDAGGLEPSIPAVSIGEGTPLPGDFSIGLSLTRSGFGLSPDLAATWSVDSPAEAGVAAAGAALNEAFQYVYRKAPLAGQRDITFALPGQGTDQPVDSVWLVGLGHLGQSFIWTAALAGRIQPWRAVRLTDYDVVSWSSLSTCLLVKPKDVGRRKVDVVAERLEALGVEVIRDDKRLDLDDGQVRAAEGLVLIAVDNVALRRTLDRLEAPRILEAGIGDGAEAFTRTQLHAFPGPRKAMDVWAGDDVRSGGVVDLSKPAYQALVEESGDVCGTTLVAGRSIATPFVGAFVGALLSALTARPEPAQHAWSYDLNNL